MLARHLRTALLLTLTTAGLAAGCGGERESTPGPTRLNVPGTAAEPKANSTVGLLVSADQSSMVLKSKKGFETFIIRNEDRAALGLDHLSPTPATASASR